MAGTAGDSPRRSRGRSRPAALGSGLEASIEEVVTDATTALAMGSGAVPVLGTPAIVALVERAACRAVESYLPGHQTSVGAWVNLSHLAPTPAGARVRASARLVEVEGGKLTFEVRVEDEAGEVARGSHGRVIVDREPFLEAAERRRSGPGGSD